MVTPLPHREPGRRRRAAAAAPIAVVALLTVLLGGCVSSNTNSALHSGTSDPGSIVHGNALTIDLTRRPTRADLGIPATSSFRAYGRSGPMLATTLKLPTGTLTVPATSVMAATDEQGGASDPNHAHEPKFFTISQTFTSVAQAREELTKHAGVLGLSPSEIDEDLPDLGTGATVPQTRVLHGLVHGWLSASVDLTDGDEPGVVKADYQLAIDVYHNPALDRVVHDGVFTADLTRKPTRADLGLLPGYGVGQAQPAWRQRLSIRWTLPTGVLHEPVTSVLTYSGSADTLDSFGTAEPAVTTVLLATGDFAEARVQLERDTPLLGLDPKAVAALFEGPPDGPRVRKTLKGGDTGAYAVDVTADLGRSATAPGTGSIRYTFSWK
jgi:hypothetical protein